MKMISILMLSIFAVPVHAQKHLGALQTYQKSLPPPAVATPDASGGTQSFTSTTSTGALVNGVCEAKDQSSLPLKYILGLIRSNPAQLSIKHDPRSGVLAVSADSIVGNCASMIDWRIHTRNSGGQKSYSIEARLSSGNGCYGGLCSYKIKKVVNGELQPLQEEKFAPTMKGFEECLERSGVIKDNKIVDSAVYPGVLAEKFPGVRDSGSVNFVQNGLASPMVGAAYGNFTEINGCNHYENIAENPVSVVSAQDQAEADFQKELGEVKDCEDYGQMTDFINKYKDQAADVVKIRAKLIADLAAKSIAALKSGKYTAEDSKILKLFNDYVVEPKLNDISDLYDELQEAKPEEKAEIEQALKEAQAEATALNKEPYLDMATVQKLIADGQFDDAASANRSRLLLAGYSQLGVKRLGEVTTPERIDSQVEKETRKFIAALEVEREKREIRTGQIPGKSKHYTNLVSKMSQNIQIRSQNFGQEINSEYRRMQQGCQMRVFAQAIQRCMADSQQRIQELQAKLQYYNQVDTQRAQEYQAQAVEYAKLEEEGKRYIASQGGDPAAMDQANDSLTPGARTDSAYTFQAGAQQQNQDQYYQQMAAQQQQQAMLQQQQMQYNQQYPMSSYQQPMYQNMYAQQPMYNQNNFGYQQNYMGYQQPMYNQNYMGYQNFQQPMYNQNFYSGYR